MNSDYGVYQMSESSVEMQKILKQKSTKKDNKKKPKKVENKVVQKKEEDEMIN